jgi:hypothetical protein
MSEDTENTTRFPRNRNWKIDRTDIARWVGKLPEEQQALIYWLDDYARGRDLPMDDLASRLKQPTGKAYSRDSVYQSITGRREPEQLANFLQAVADLKKLETERDKITRIGFVETDISRRIFKACDTTRNFGKLGIIVGNTHIGKTTALAEYTRRNNHGATQYVRMPAGGGLTMFLRRLADVLNVANTGNNHTIGTKIAGRFDSRTLLIVDEFHQCFPRPTANRRNTGKPAVFYTIEWLRELHDITGCPILYSVTPVYDQAMKDETFAGIFKQTLQRAMLTVRLPDAPTRKSLDSFAKHFGLEPAKHEALDIQTEVVTRHSLGKWTSILEGASRIASHAGAPLDWEHVLKSHAALVRLENGD